MNSLKFSLALLVGLLFINPLLLAQAGGAAVPFLMISPDARASGMGEAGTAIADNIDAVYWNPAGLGFLKQTELKENVTSPYFESSYSYSKWLPQFNSDLFYFNGSQGIFVKQMNGFIALNLTYMDLGEFQRTFEDGSIGQKFKSNEFALGLAYGTSVGKNFGIGMQLKYIRSKLSPVSVYQVNDAGEGTSAAFDVGVLWKPDFGYNDRILFHRNFLSFGMNLQNVGPKITYRRESDPLPTNLRLGTAINIINHKFHKLTIACDASKLLVKRDSLGSDPLPKSFLTAWENEGGMEWSFGIEYWIYKWFAVRNGYLTESARLGNRKYYTFGASARIFFVEADLSVLKTIEENHPLANTVRFSLIVGGDNLRFGR